ncbi:hypothetical protein CROQUDRAFT_613435 [Cronartium quercuum f. sp. fusiforme G11]|uniref:Uncharacterized protein n=1 Tax=Cronartium quercuum f. sp. fusiforme G11 TaxID=708437 RepID=A0A9P6T9Y9_9BASI|nr:hypothetical protein CROQUDRAFT_613435 [Cronartium quercuum f. sp. fusiforme G11]
MKQSKAKRRPRHSRSQAGRGCCGISKTFTPVKKRTANKYETLSLDQLCFCLFPISSLRSISLVVFAPFQSSLLFLSSEFRSITLSSPSYLLSVEFLCQSWLPLQALQARYY